jgi:alkylation response protein AidB-like acyl-CoA dehydrogenase
MDFRLSDDRRMLAETLDRFLRDNYPLEKRHAFAASEDGYSREMWEKFCELGAVGAMFKETMGGFGGEGADLAVLFEPIGRALVVEPFLPTLLAGSVFAALDGEGQAALLGQIISGEKLVALAHTEAQARYDLSDVAVRAIPGEKEHVISGSKSVVLGGAGADWLVVTARMSGAENDIQGISAFLVDASHNGISRRSYTTVDGYRAAEIEFADVAATLLGKEGAAYAALEYAHARAIVAVCAECLGAMEIAKDLTVEYMHNRTQFGVPIGKFQALQHRMADVLIEIEQMRSAVVNAAGHLEDDRVEREWHVSAAKNLAGRAGRQVAEEAIQIHGGMGMTWEYPVSHYAKRIVMIDHLFGDTDHHLERFIALSAER